MSSEFDWSTPFYGAQIGEPVRRYEVIPIHTPPVETPPEPKAPVVNPEKVEPEKVDSLW